MNHDKLVTRESQISRRVIHDLDGPAVQTPQVSRVLHDLDAAVERLYSVFSSFEARLSSVISTEPVDPEACAKSHNPGLVPLANQINTITLAVCSLSDRMINLTRRIELE